jgi:hypothetical protein
VPVFSEKRGRGLYVTLPNARLRKPRHFFGAAVWALHLAIGPAKRNDGRAAILEIAEVDHRVLQSPEAIHADSVLRFWARYVKYIATKAIVPTRDD